MVGHTGVLGRDARRPRGRRRRDRRGSSTRSPRVEAADPAGPGAALLITADHGNADEIRDAAGNPVTAHSLNPVPLLPRARACEGRALHDGVLADVAPTILELAGLPALGRHDRPVAARPAMTTAGEPSASRDRRSATIRDRHHPEVNPPVNPILAIGQILHQHRADRRHPAPGARHRPVRHVRRRLRRLPQPPRHRAPPVAVHDRAARPVRAVRAGVLRRSSA